MNNSESLHNIIFVTDKYGRRNKTGYIEKLQYDSRKDGESDSLIICRRNCRTVERKVRGSENGR